MERDLEHRIDQLYLGAGDAVDVLDVFTGERHHLSPRALIDVAGPPRPRAATGPARRPLDAVVVSVPHAGVLIPSQFADRFPLDEGHLREIDLFSHLLYEHLPVVRVTSRLAPTFIDMNRVRVGADEPHVPRHLRNSPHDYYTVADEPILSQPYSPKEAEHVLRWYDLFHGLLDAQLGDARRRCGWALLVDGHSMTSVGLGRVHDEGRERESLVVGTLYGASADDAIIDAFVSSLRRDTATSQLGLTVAENDPYSGGAITRVHHDPPGDTHAIQIEVTMESYMYESDEPDPRRRFTIKQHRLDVLRRVLLRAVEAAAEAGEASIA